MNLECRFDEFSSTNCLIKPAFFIFCKPSISPFTVACRSFCWAERLRSVVAKSKAPALHIEIEYGKQEPYAEQRVQNYI